MEGRLSPRGSRNQRRQPSIDGVINRRGREIYSPFKKIPNVNSISTSTSNKVIGNHAATADTSNKLAWAPQMKDPSSISLKRDLGDKRGNTKSKTREHKRNWKKIAKRSSMVVACLVLIVGGYVGFKFFRNIDKVFGGNVVSNIGSLFGTTTLKGEAQGRVNILLAGDSADDPGHQGAQLTDSIMLVSINTKNNTAFMLSIPRDLWVYIPGLQSYQKINAANDVSNFSSPGYPSGGMGQLEQVISQNLDIPIDYYALIDYSAFKDSVDAVGGIKVDIQSPDPRGLYDSYTHLDLSNGWQTLNGQEALNLARARGDNGAGDISYGFPDSDYDRTEHQRQMLVALAQKASSLGVLTNPVRIGQLFDSVGNNVQTNLSLADVIALAHIAKQANLSKAQSLTFSDSGTNPLLSAYLTPTGQDALAPTAGVNNFSQLQLYYQKLTSNNPVVKESASVVILNGGNTDGLAGDYQKDLIPKGVNVTSVADAPELYNTTEIMDNSNGADPATKQLLSGIFGNNFVANDPSINTSGANFVVILGKNQGLPG